MPTLAGQSVSSIAKVSDAMTRPPRPAPSRRPRDAGDYIRWFDEIGLDDVASVGGKTASLGEMTRALAGSGVRLPTGFAVTADAYRRFVAANGLEAAITARERARQSGSETLEAFSDAVRAAFRLRVRRRGRAEQRDSGGSSPCELRGSA
jgi:hypothetical protein